jgi:hypothetical protein
MAKKRKSKKSLDEILGDDVKKTKKSIKSKTKTKEPTAKKSTPSYNPKIRKLAQGMIVEHVEGDIDPDGELIDLGTINAEDFMRMDAKELVKTRLEDAEMADSVTEELDGIEIDNFIEEEVEVETLKLKELRKRDSLSEDKKVIDELIDELLG